jgi:hypothetical protein
MPLTALAGDVSPQMFKASCDSILRLMEDDNFARFKASPAFEALIGQSERCGQS